MRRRDFIATAGAAGVTGLAGCAGGGGSGDAATESDGTATEADDGGTAASTGTTTGTPNSTPTLQVGTYGAFVDAPSSSPGPWLKERFESEFDAALEWQTPDNELNYFIERSMGGVGVDADVYVGLDTNMLIRVDEQVDGGLFASAADVPGRDSVKPGLEFDPQGRAVPYDTGYICLVYDENELTAPETFDGLLESEYAGDLLTQDPTTAATGQAFLLHTIDATGEDGYLDYWQDLRDNDVRVLGSWSDSYTAYTEGEAPMVVSYSTDQVFANAEGADLSKHQIRFLNGEGYANPEGVAVFEETDRPELAREFIGFMLQPEVQAEIAVRNVQFPATDDAELPSDFAQYAKEPETPVTFSYDALKGNLSEWTDAWARQFASK